LIGLMIGIGLRSAGDLLKPTKPCSSFKAALRNLTLSEIAVGAMRFKSKPPSSSVDRPFNLVNRNLVQDVKVHTHVISKIVEGKALGTPPVAFPALRAKTPRR
jgi:hypothetical protein